MKPFEVGDRVAYSADWLINTGQQASVNDIGHWRGEVTSIQPFGERSLIVVRWDHGEVGKVIDSNLAHVGLNVRFCKC